MFQLLLLTLAVEAQAASPPPPETETPAMLVALANKPLVKKQPAFQSGPESDFSQLSKDAGEHGQVVISAILGVDGRLSEVRVVKSSRSPRLDASALAAAQRMVFKPARDGADEPISIPVRVPISFDNAHTPGKGGGISRYRCDQVVRDQNWWTATWGAGSHDEIYTMLLGFSALSRSRSGSFGIDPQAFAPAGKAFPAQWDAAMEACRKTPTALLVDMMGQDGAAMRRTAEAVR